MSESISCTIDWSTGAIYIKVREGRAERTVEEVRNAVFVDLDAAGHLLGVEIIDPAALSELPTLARKYKVPLLERISPEALQKVAALA